jgi:hypothetical protein
MMETVANIKVLKNYCLAIHVTEWKTNYKAKLNIHTNSPAWPIKEKKNSPSNNQFCPTQNSGHFALNKFS